MFKRRLDPGTVNYLQCGLLLVLSWFTPGAGAAIVVDNTSTVVGRDPTSLTVSHTTGTGSDRLMIVGVSLNNDDFEIVDSVTYNGVGLTFVGERSNEDDSRIEIWTYLAPPSITADVVVTFDEEVQQGAGFGVVTLTGVDQASPYGAFQSNIGDSTNANMNATSASGETVFGVITADQQDDNPVVVGGSELWTYKTRGGNNRTAGAAATYTGAPLVNLSWTLNEEDDWALGAISLREAPTVVSPGYCDDFESGLGNWIINATGGDAGISGVTFSSASNSLYTRWAAVSVTTATGINTTGTPFEASVWIRRGDDLFSEDPDTGENLLIEYLNSANNWITLETFPGDGTPGEVFIRNYALPVDAQHSNLQLRLVQLGGNGNNFDYWHIDDVCLLPAPVTVVPDIEFRMDEAQWTGAANEVVDSSGNDLHANAFAGSGLTTIDPGQICRAGSFDGTNDYIESSDIYGYLSDTSSLSFWIRTTQTGNNTGWLAPGVAGVEQAGGGDDIFWGWLDASGRIGMSVGNDYSLATRSTAPINDGTYHHVVLTRDAGSGAYTIYIDGVLDRSGTQATGVIGNGFTSIGRIEDTGGTPTYLQGELDEVLVFDSVLSNAEVQSIFNNQSMGLNLDGSARSCSVVLDSFQITPATVTGSTCLPNAVTIIALDAASNPITTYSNQVDISVSTGHGTWSVNDADNSTIPDPDITDDGDVSYTYLLSDEGEIVLDLTNTHAETLIITVDDLVDGVTSTSVPISFASNVLVISEDPVQVAGRPMSMSVALWTDDLAGSATCGIDTNYNSSSQDLVANIDRGGVLSSANDPSIGVETIPDGPAAVTVTLDFSIVPGQANFNLATSDVGQYTLSLEDQTLVHSDMVISGTSAELTVRPFGLAITTIETGAGPTSNPGGTAPGDTIFTSAGTDFSATVAAVLWDAADDTNDDGVLDSGFYAGNTIAPSFAWDSTLAVSASGFTPATGLPGSLNNGSILLAEFTAGSATVTDLQYTEVGSFTLQATAMDFLGNSSADIISDDIVVGRFTPASFDVSITADGTLAESCGVFSYLGQAFSYTTAPDFTVTARNALGATTAQYRDTFVNLNGSSVSTTASQDDTTAGSDAAALLVSYTPAVMAFTANNDGTVSYTFGADVFRYGPSVPALFSKYANSQVAPFVADINPEITQVADGEVSTSYTSGTHLLDPSGNNQRFGRLRMENAHGSELNDLLMPVFTEYWNGFSFQKNTLDTCSLIADAHLVSIASPLALAVPTVDNAPAAAGDIIYRYPSPGANNVGFIDTVTDLSLASHLWLRYDWDADGDYDEDPDARAIFGIFEGDRVQIYIQQIYE